MSVTRAILDIAEQAERIGAIIVSLAQTLVELEEQLGRPGADEDADVIALERAATRDRQTTAGLLMELEAALAATVGSFDPPSMARLLPSFGLVTPGPARLASWIRAGAPDVPRLRDLGQAFEVWAALVRMEAPRSIVASTRPLRRTA